MFYYVSIIHTDHVSISWCKNDFEIIKMCFCLVTLCSVFLLNSCPRPVLMADLSMCMYDTNIYRVSSRASCKYLFVSQASGWTLWKCPLVTMMKHHHLSVNLLQCISWLMTASWGLLFLVNWPLLWLHSSGWRSLENIQSPFLWNVKLGV